MIICAALKLVTKAEKEMKTEIIVPCCRHADGYSIIRDLNADYHDYEIEEGFIDNRNEFYTREEAYKKACEVGQLPYQIIIDKSKSTEKMLFSEDLY